MCSYYRKFVRNFATIARPLINLTKQDLPFIWTSEHQDCFEMLKRKLTTTSVLAHFYTNKETQLRTDASKNGLGAVLVQKHEDKWKPIAFSSRSLRGSEINYGISNLVKEPKIENYLVSLMNNVKSQSVIL